MILKLSDKVMNFRLDTDNRLEKAIQASIMNYLKKIQDANFVKIAQGPWSKGGVSDIIGCYHGYFVAIEVKRKNTYPTEIQIKYLNDIIRAGGFSVVARSVTDVKKALKKIGDMI